MKTIWAMSMPMFLGVFFELTAICALQLQPEGITPVQCGQSTQFNCSSSSALVSWQIGLTPLSDCDAMGCVPAKKNNYSFTGSGSNYYLTINPLKSSDNGVNVTCADLTGSSKSVQMNVKVQLTGVGLSLTTESSEGDSVSLKLTTPCFHPVSSASEIKWYYEKDNDKVYLRPENSLKTSESTGCSGDCAGQKLVAIVKLKTYPILGISRTIKAEFTVDSLPYTMDSDRMHRVEVQPQPTTTSISSTTTITTTITTESHSSGTRSWTSRNTSDIGIVEAIIGGSVGGYVVVISSTGCVLYLLGR